MKVTGGSGPVTRVANFSKAIGTADVAGLTTIIDGIATDGTAIMGMTATGTIVAIGGSLESLSPKPG